MTTTASRVAVSQDAAALLRQLTAQHGKLMFHQSGGCCDGSAPMCFPVGMFLTGPSDVHLGELEVGLDDPIHVWIYGGPVRVLEVHPPHHRRRAGARRGVQCGIPDRQPLHHPVADAR